MREFLTGLMVVMMFLLLSTIAILLLPFVIVLGFFLKWLISVIFLMLAIWLLGKVTLWAIERVKN